MHGLVIVMSSELLPCFGVIVNIIVADVDDIHFVMKKLLTSFVPHFHSFKVSYDERCSYFVCKTTQFYDPRHYLYTIRQMMMNILYP